jgi:3-oxoadipate CoA-transferase alpha subunit
MIDKRVSTADEALAGIADGATVMLSGFQGSGVANALIGALIETGTRNLTLIANGAGHPASKQGELIGSGAVAKLICSSARGRGRESTPFEERWLAGDIELELVPQGTFAERIRAGGAGIPAFYTPVGADTALAEGKERRTIDGRDCILETALTADFTLLRAERGDRWGNLVYVGTQANFSPVMAMAGRVTVAEVSSFAPDGALAPESIRTPGIFVNRIVEQPDTR